MTDAPFFFFVASALIIAWSLYRIFFGSRHFDFLTVFYLFCLFFFGVAPVVQIAQGLTLAPMYDETLSALDYLKTDIVVIGIIALFECVYRVVFKVASSSEDNPSIGTPIREKTYECRSVFLWGVVVVLAFLVFMWYEEFNLTNLLMRGGDEDVGRQEGSKLVSLLCGKALRYVPLSAALFYWLYGDKNKLIVILLWFAAVLCCFPTGMTRLQIVPVYLPVIMICIKWIRDKKMWLVSGLVGGILFIFPLLHGFREKEVDLSEFHFMDFSFLNALHFDSFASLAIVMKNHFITNGHQLLGSLLFWFPRNLWHNKPIESGRLIAEEFDLGMGEFTNLALNWFGEGYLNFGWIGIAIWCVVLAAVCGWLDAWFWHDERNFDKKAAIYYFSGVGFLFFLLRGDMMSGVAFTIGLLASHKLMDIVMLRKVENEEA